jgi:ribosomal protein L6P/L9E
LQQKLKVDQESRYKGKGVKFVGEVLRRKAVKSAKK